MLFVPVPDESEDCGGCGAHWDDPCPCGFLDRDHLRGECAEAAQAEMVGYLAEMAGN